MFPFDARSHGFPMLQCFSAPPAHSVALPGSSGKEIGAEEAGQGRTPLLSHTRTLLFFHNLPPEVRVVRHDTNHRNGGSPA